MLYRWDPNAFFAALISFCLKLYPCHPRYPPSPSSLQRFNDLTRRSHFPRNLVLVSVLYLTERPEMTSHDEEPMKVRTTNLKRKKQQ